DYCLGVRSTTGLVRHRANRPAASRSAPIAAITMIGIPVIGNPGAADPPEPPGCVGGVVGSGTTSAPPAKAFFLSTVVVTSLTEFCTTVGSFGYDCWNVLSSSLSTFTGWVKSTPPVMTTRPSGPVYVVPLISFTYLSK